MGQLNEGEAARRPRRDRDSWLPVLVSIALHAAVLWWLTGKLEASLPQIQSPFVVDLVTEMESEHSDLQSGQGRVEEIPGEGRVPEEPQRTEEPTTAEEPSASTEAATQPADPQSLTGEELVDPAPDEVIPERSESILEVFQESLLSRSEPVLDVPADRRESSRGGGSGVPGALGSAAGITGPLGERSLLHMELPDYPSWARRQGIEAAVRFRFWVSPEGHVIRIETKRRCAYPELESSGREALLRWVFAALPYGELREEWGEVSILWRLDEGGEVDVVTEGESQ